MLESLTRAAALQVTTAASAEEFLARPPAMSPSCLLTELRLPGLTGLDLQRLTLERRELPLIFMGEQIAVEVAVQAMKGGALDVLTKPLGADVLLSTIWRALERSRATLNRLAQLQLLEQRYASLSARERAVMSLVISGRLNKQIGAELGISEITVKVHRGKVMRKMGARSLPELVMLGLRTRAISGMERSVPTEPLTTVESLRPRTAGIAANIRLASEPLPDRGSLH